MTQNYRINIIEPGPRPPFYRVAEHLWGVGCNIDSDGDSRTPLDSEWTELTISLRGPAGQRVDVDPASFEPLVLRVNASCLQLAEAVAHFIVNYSGGTLQHVVE